MKRRTRFWLRAALVLLGALALMDLPLRNGYPLFYSDAGTYLWSAAQMFVPVDRPIGYGLFVRPMMAVPSLWFVIFVQAVGTSFLMFRVAELLLAQVPRREWIAFGIVVLTALLTPISLFVGFVIPDALTGWLWLTALLFWLAPARHERIVALFLGELTLLAHASHVWIALGTLVLVAPLVLWDSKTRLTRARQLGPLFLAVLGGIVINVGLNAYLGVGPQVTRGSGTYMISRLEDAGILPTTLKVYCGTEKWILCDYQDTLAANQGRGAWFLWDAASPLARTGWTEGEGEYADITRHAFQCCLTEIAAMSVNDSWNLFWRTSAGNQLLVMAENTEAMRALRGLYPQELAMFQASGQQRGQPPNSLVLWNNVGLQIIWLAAALLLFGAALMRRDERGLLLWASLLVLLCVNAVFMATLSSLTSRYQARIFWLLVYFAFVQAAELWFAWRAQARRGTIREPGLT